MLASFFTTYFVHVLTGNGYNFWSGIGSDFGEVTILGGIVMLYRQHECRLDGCHRPSFHVHPEHGALVCRKHFHETGIDHVGGGAPLHPNARTAQPPANPNPPGPSEPPKPPRERPVGELPRNPSNRS